MFKYLLQNIPKKQQDSLQILQDVYQQLTKINEHLSNTSHWYQEPKIVASGLLWIVGLGFAIFAFKKAQKARTIINRLDETVSNLETQSENLSDEITDFRKEISTLKDINRPFLKTFPEMMNKLNDIFQTALSDPDNSEIYIMNRTSAFGKIHMYNPKFYSQYNIEKVNELNVEQKYILEKLYSREKETLDDLNSSKDKSKYLFSEDVRLLYEKVIECSCKLPDNKFKLIVFPADKNRSLLQNNFIKQYYLKVNTNDDVSSGKGLEDFIFIPKPHKGKARISSTKCESDLSNKSNVELEILKKVVSKHNEIIDLIEEGKNTKTEKEEWLRESANIPMQIYLLKSMDNSIPKYQTLIINAMDTGSKEDGDRDIDGLFSTEKSLYNVFKTLFDDTFKES